MATKEEVLAAAQRAEAAGDTAAAAKLRAYADTLEAPQYDRAKIEAAAEKAKAAGDTAAFEKLSAFAQTLPGPAQPAPEITAPPRVEAQQAQAAEMATGELAAFEAANPKLKGMFQPGDELPAVGSGVRGVYDGGGGRSGGIPYQVKDWKGGADTWTDTAGAMMEGPLSAVSAFGGGLMGGESPTRGFLANDPLTRNLPGPVLTGLGAVGDFGGAGLSLLGAGMGAGAGLVSELVPGQSAQDERKLAGDLSGMAMFAAPELAGVSSVGAMAGGAGRAAKAADTVIPDNIAAGRAAVERGIPVMRSDIKPPTTFIGKTVQQAGEIVPIAGTGGQRAAQQTARLDAIREMVSDFGAEAEGVIKDVADSVLRKYDAALTKYSGQKKEIVERLDGAGAIATPKTQRVIDEQIALISRGTKDVADKIVPILKGWKDDLAGKSLSEMELVRKQIGERFKAADLGDVRGTGEKVLSAIYAPLKADISDFIGAAGKAGDAKKWSAANEALSSLMTEAKDTALKGVLRKGEATPEVVANMLFSSKASDVKRLYDSLDARGQAAAKAAVLQRAFEKAGGAEALSAEKFITQLDKLANPIGVFFKGADREAVTGLEKALRLTRRAADASVAPPTGVRALPYVASLGLGSAIGLVPGVATAGGVGLLARIYENAGVKRALMAVAKAKPAQEATALKRLNEALKDAGAPAAAQQNQAPDYEGLRRRYAQ